MQKRKNPHLISKVLGSLSKANEFIHNPLNINIIVLPRFQRISYWWCFQAFQGLQPERRTKTGFNFWTFWNETDGTQEKFWM